MKLSKEVLGYDIIIGASYFPHEGSVYFDDEMFNVLCSDIIDLNSTYNVPLCLAGDFNARTSNLNDFVTYDDMNSTHTFSPFEFDLLSDSISNLELLGIPLERVSKDCKTNKSGDKLIEICKDFDLRILNT